MRRKHDNQRKREREIQNETEGQLEWTHHFDQKMPEKKRCGDTE